MAARMDLFLILNSNVSMELILSKIREFQTHEINKGRTVFGEYHHLFPLLRNYPNKMKQYLRMDVETFQYLMSKTEALITKNWCNFHTRPIFPEEQVVLVLRFLATGNSYSQMSFPFRLGISTISTIVKRVLDVIWEVMHPIHMPVPSQEKFLEIAEQFFSKWDFPHCLGAIDGRHIRIKKPAHSGSLYYNYKKFFSIVLQAVVNSNYKFIFIDVGGYGHQSDGGTFKNSDLYKALFLKKLNLPVENELPNSDLILPYYFIGDGAYPLMENVMKPYPGQNLNSVQKLFNKRLSRARAVVENSFGFMCQKWQIFYTTIDKPPETVTAIVKCACVLNNIIIDLEHGHFNAPSASNTAATASDLMPLLHSQSDFEVGSAKEVRFELTKYFIEETADCRNIMLAQADKPRMFSKVLHYFPASSATVHLHF